MEKFKRYYVLIFILIMIIVISISASYAIFSNTKEEHGKLNIVAGTLDYKIENKNLKIRRLFVRSLYNHESYLHRKSPADTPPTYEDRSDSYLSVPLTYYQTGEKPPSGGKHFPHKPFSTQT